MASLSDNNRAGIVDYYRAVQLTLLAHLKDREVFGVGPDRPGPQIGTARTRWAPGEPQSTTNHSVRLHLADVADIDEAVRSGIVGFRLPALSGPGMVALRLRAGEGTGIDTVATAALALAQSMARDGLATTVLTDGSDGLYLIAFGVGSITPGGVAGRYATALELVAPEIATVNLADFDGRTLVEALTDGGISVPSPYSLVPVEDSQVPVQDELGVIVPLTLDEVAAASAGMPLGIEPPDVANRITGYGDLAAALSEATARCG